MNRSVIAVVVSTLVLAGLVGLLIGNLAGGAS